MLKRVTLLIQQDIRGRHLSQAASRVDCGCRWAADKLGKFNLTGTIHQILLLSVVMPNSFSTVGSRQYHAALAACKAFRMELTQLARH